MKIIFTAMFALLSLSCNQTSDKKELVETPFSESQISETLNEEEILSEDFENLETEDFNMILDSHKKDLTAKEVMHLYYPHQIENAEGNEEINVNEELLHNGNTMVTLIHDNQMDDSVKAEKIVLELAKSEGKWKAISIKKNWQCYDGRGHTDWGTEFCL